MPPKKGAIYGNIFEESIEDIMRRAGIRCASEFDLIQKYQEYTHQIVIDGKGQKIRR